MNLLRNNYIFKKNFNPLIILILGAFLFYSCQDSLDSMSSDMSGGSIMGNPPGKKALTMDVSEATGDEFKVFDATGFKGKPQMSHFGIRPIHMIRTGDLFESPRNKNNRWDEPTDKMIRITGKQAKDAKSRAVMIIMQHWPTEGGDDDFVQKGTSRYSRLYHDLKKIIPNKHIGYFNTLPVKNWWTKPPSQKRLKIWNNKNNRLKNLAAKVNVFYLKGFAKTSDQERWARNIKYYIEETRRINDGQPIYLVLKPYYHNGRRELIEKGFWQKQLQTAKEYADGIVLQGPDGARWDKNAPWWDATKAFMEELGEYAAEPKVSDSKFKVYDGTRFNKMPNMSRFGFTPLEIVYQVRLWDKPMRNVDRWELPSKSLVEKWAQKSYETNNKIMMIDIEHWPVSGSNSEVQRSIDNYSTVYNWFKNEQPGMKVGYFNTVPFKIHWKDYPQIKWIKNIIEKNDRLTPLANTVDVFFPQAYTYNKDREAWLINTKYMLKQANQYNGDKPVYLMLWPQYYAKDNPSLHWDYIEEEFWKLQLETARKYADGVVIWFPNEIRWSDAESAPWWNVTKRFLRDMGKAE